MSLGSYHPKGSDPSANHACRTAEAENRSCPVPVAIFVNIITFPFPTRPKHVATMRVERARSLLIRADPLGVRGPVQAHFGNRKQTYTIGVVVPPNLGRDEPNGFSERAPSFQALWSFSGDVRRVSRVINTTYLPTYLPLLVIMNQKLKSRYHPLGTGFNGGVEKILRIAVVRVVKEVGRETTWTLCFSS
ncbi:hypothetical protein B0H14DRAFT_2592865 [Mycena olivaceomarginata]|nr:hypothetical protein B0H14DRAFT_2592865 [Mycena olivaceomarginata]